MSSNGKSGWPSSRGNVPTFVAEVSSNHHRDLDRSMEFIKTAAAIGCDAVKFQLFRARELFAPEALQHNPKLLAREEWELPVKFLPALAQGCKEAGIRFSCTPFYLEAIAELLPFVDFYKIASYELMWDELLKVCAESGKPVVLSTGMATLPEVKHACSVLEGAGCRELTLLHCVSSYPAKPEECNLAAIETLQKACGYPVGWSDHSVDAGVVSRAVHRWGATMIEFHLDLEGQGAEFGAGHCWLPQPMRELIASVRAGFHADGDGEVGPVASELEEREWRADPGDGLRPTRSTRKSLGLAKK